MTEGVGRSRLRTPTITARLSTVEHAECDLELELQPISPHNVVSARSDGGRPARPVPFVVMTSPQTQQPTDERPRWRVWTYEPTWDLHLQTSFIIEAHDARPPLSLLQNAAHRDFVYYAIPEGSDPAQVVPMPPAGGGVYQ